MQDIKKPQISVLIVNYKQKKDLYTTVTNLSGFLQGITYEVLIFDNSGELTKSNSYTLYTKNKNLGYASAIDYLAINAVGDYYLILNPDIEFKATLKPLFSRFKKLPVHFGVLSLGSSQMLYNAPILNMFNSKKRFSSYAFLVYKDVFNSVGGFNINYFFYFEDNEFALNLQKFGIKTYYPSQEFVKHKKTYTNIKFKTRKLHYYKSLLVYLKRSNKLSYFIFFVPLKIAIKILS